MFNYLAVLLFHSSTKIKNLPQNNFKIVLTLLKKKKKLFPLNISLKKKKSKYLEAFVLGQ